MKILLFVLVSICANKIYAQNVAIGTTTPKAAFNVAEGKTVLFGGDSTGVGNKVLWFPSKAAFRAGSADADQFNYNKVGSNSIGLGTSVLASNNYAISIGYKTNASGYNAIAIGETNTASGQESMAMGTSTKASGGYSTAMGYFSDATGEKATAIGNSTTASGDYATAMGSTTLASGNYSTAMGKGSVANGLSSTAIGYNAYAYGNYSVAAGYNAGTYGAYATAMGTNSTASGDYSTAMGRNSSTNNHLNSFCIGGSATDIANTSDNQMMMRFDNYTFFVAGTNNYAYLIPASNGWAYTSDINRKERFEELNGENVLDKIANIPFYSWNFKDKEVKQYRHYGIMAQDFYQAFGKDKYGSIGNDTTVSPLDLLGVAYSGIKALEKRTAALQTENDRMTEELATFKMMMEAIKQKIDQLPGKAEK